MKAKVKVAQSCSTLCDPMDPMDCTVHGILQVRNIGLGSLSLLQGIFPTHGSNPHLLHCRQILYQLSHKGSPRMIPSSAYLPDPGIKPESPALRADSWPTELSGKPRPFRYDLIQIHYYYTVGVKNRFKGLDLVERVPEELWMGVHNTVQEAVIKIIPKKKKCKKAKWLSQEAYK